MENVLWGLEYRGGLLRQEPAEGETILHAPKGYVALHLVDRASNRSLMRVEVPEKCRAIFYRCRSAAIGDIGDSRLDATVFGFGQDPEYMENEEQSKDELNVIWMWDPNNHTHGNVPKQYVREGAIKHLLTSPVGV